MAITYRAELGGWWYTPDPPSRGVERKAGEARYVEVKAPSVTLDHEVEGVLDEALAEFGLGRGVSVRWFSPADCPPAWQLTAGKQFDGQAHLNGYIDHEAPKVVWLNRALASKGDLLWWVALHEIEHSRQELKRECNPGLNDRELERKADAFADAALPGFRRRVA